jgi:hypothetical protein
MLVTVTEQLKKSPVTIEPKYLEALPLGLIRTEVTKTKIILIAVMWLIDNSCGPGSKTDLNPTIVRCFIVFICRLRNDSFNSPLTQFVINPAL